MDDFSDLPEWYPNQSSKTWLCGYVYVIDYGDGKTFKIGHTTNDPEERLNQIARGDVIMPMQLVMDCVVNSNCRYLENLIQMRFDHRHARGEWFKLGFVDLVEVYQCLTVLGNCTKLYDRWFDLVPTDYGEYLEYHGISGVLPYFTEKERAEALSVHTDWGNVVEALSHGNTASR